MGTKTFKDLTTFRVGGRIAHYKEVRNKSELEEAVKFAKSKKLSIFILGGGSDILVSDKDFDGVVIRYTGRELKVRSEKAEVLITTEAGMEWDALVDYSVKKNLQGIECLSGIPGSVGAAPVQNIGAYGQELKNTFVSLTAYDIEKEKFVVFTGADCGFSYRESIFKTSSNWQRFIITDITLKLKTDGKPEVKYESLKDYLAERKIGKPTLKQVREAVLTIRKSKFENPKEVGNAGSFFKNPIVERSKLDELIELHANIKFFESNGKFKLSAGWLIEKAGWKGKTFKTAAVSANHALVLINPKGKAAARDVLALSQKIINDVFDKFGIYLEREVQLINFVKVGILGHGVEGQDVENHLKGSDCAVTILDKKLDTNYLQNLSSFDIVVRSPGVYRYLPEIVSAENAGVKITSAIKIFFENCRARIIGVTGTKGKGTTSTLIYEILKNAGMDVYLAGNIGVPYLELLPELTVKSVVVLEMSSFQLIDMDISPHIAVVLNITSDHMDWHESQKEYVDAKKNIVRFQRRSDYAVINSEYDTSKSFEDDTAAKKILFSKGDLERRYKEGVFLRGEHNLENVAAAVAVAKLLKIDDKTVLGVLRSFKGLEHRLELVATINGRTFYNDSFATGPQPTIAAIKSFTEPETLILGGSDKGLDYKELRSEIEKRKNVKNLILIGEIGEKIAGGIKGKKIINLDKTSMKAITEKAYEVTPKGGIVILSPATASFDMFENYKDRGNQFKEAVQNLKNG